MRTLVLSRCSTASASPARAAPPLDSGRDPQEYESTHFSPVHVRPLCPVNSLEEVFDFSAAVHERIQMNAARDQAA